MAHHVFGQNPWYPSNPNATAHYQSVAPGHPSQPGFAAPGHADAAQSTPAATYYPAAPATGQAIGYPVAAVAHPGNPVPPPPGNYGFAVATHQAPYPARPHAGALGGTAPQPYVGAPQYPRPSQPVEPHEPYGRISATPQPYVGAPQYPRPSQPVGQHEPYGRNFATSQPYVSAPQYPAPRPSVARHGVGRALESREEAAQAIINLVDHDTVVERYMKGKRKSSWTPRAQYQRNVEKLNCLLDTFRGTQHEVPLHAAVTKYLRLHPESSLRQNSFWNELSAAVDSLATQAEYAMITDVVIPD